MKKPAVARSRTQDTSGLSLQCFATEPQQLDNHQPSQSVRRADGCPAVVAVVAVAAVAAVVAVAAGVRADGCPAGEYTGPNI